MGLYKCWVIIRYDSICQGSMQDFIRRRSVAAMLYNIPNGYDLSELLDFASW